MTTHALLQASPPSAPPELDLEARLALTGALMTSRLTEAAVAIDVNTAHIPGVTLPEITETTRLTPTSVPCPYRTPIAATLHRARIRLDRDGWCTGALRDARGATCPIGAIRTEASSRYQAEDACVLLLEAIRRDFPTADTVPSWNDAQRDPRLPARYLDSAAALAHARSL